MEYNRLSEHSLGTYNGFERAVERLCSSFCFWLDSHLVNNGNANYAGSKITPTLMKHLTQNCDNETHVTPDGKVGFMIDYEGKTARAFCKRERYDFAMEIKERG